MKKLLTLLICLLAFISCKENKSSFVLSDEDNAIATLQLYQNVSPELIEERNKLYQLMLKHSTPPEEPSEEDKAYFLKNIAHIDSVVNRGVALIKEQKGEELLTLLEAEVVNFYAHPHNTVDNEILLHNLLAQLYYQTAKSKEEYIRKLIDLDTVTILHIEALQNKHPEYTTVLVNQIYNCIDVKEYDKAIFYGEKLRAFTAVEGKTEALIYASLILAEAYEKAGKTEEQNAVINSVKHYPQYAKCCKELKQASTIKE